MHRSQLRIEDKELDFEFEIINVQFNEVGQYILRLTVENPLLEGSGTGVRLQVNDGDMLTTNTGATDVIAQTNVNEIQAVLKKKFIFRLPKGFCQNDKNHDVRLRIEAFRVTGTSLRSGTKEGEAFFAIYPRTNAPRINVFAKENEDFYCYSIIVALLRVQDDELTMHCGRMACNVSFHTVRCPKDTVSQTDSLMIVPREEGGPSDLISPGSPPPALHVPLTASPQQQVPTPTSPSSIPQDETVEETNARPPEESPFPSLAEVYTRHQRLPSDSSFHLSSPAGTPVRMPEGPPYTHVIETPPGMTEATLSSPANEEHVSRPGKESISIILHGATDIPALSDGSVPQPFATVKSGSDGENHQRAQGVTHATAEPTHSPSWEEKLTVEIDDRSAEDEVVILDVADSRTKEMLISYRIPVVYLQVFRHYHIELVQPHPSAPLGIRLYITIVRKASTIPRQEGFTFTGLEVLLRGMENPLKDPVGPLLVVARIVPDHESYKNAILVKNPWLAGINATAVKCPSPHQSFFDVPQHASQGHPQISLVGNPQEQPVWDYSFLFQGRECATVFTAGSALVLEYYSLTSVMNTISWYIRSPLGFSVVPLDQGVYHTLMAESGGRGLRVDGLPVQGNNLRTISNTTPTVGLILRLIASERLDSTLAAMDPCQLPSLDLKSLASPQQQATNAAFPAVNLEISSGPHPPNKEEWSLLPTRDGTAVFTATHCEQLQQDRVNLPSYDALAQILPEYNYLFRSPHLMEKQEKEQQQLVRLPNPLQAQQTAVPSKKREPPTDDHAESQEIRRHETEELDNYRTAMQKMAEDIINLRKDVARLEVENSKLRSELSSHQDLGRILLDDTDIDVMTKAEVADRIVLLRQKLATETAELLNCKDKVQQLQNELIRKNDREAELLRSQKAHQQQLAALHKYHEKMHKSKILEDTIRQQEKVIERMEALLDKKLKERPKAKPEASKKHAVNTEDNIKKEVESVLLAENARLREEIERLRLQPVPIIVQHPMHSLKESLTDSEKLSLLAKLEKTQRRVQTLETLLEENSRKWGREKQEMLTRLSEHEHGFTRTSTMVLHDFPLALKLT
ncbi:coiled-coil domain-containing protein 33 [Stegostoma tigrinum]|uniref:coiled-coil domain-containing protein 33 n=1 Tax=Stegostoma tigrinum TaxID=3053191 RepID=UPI002870146C|nr:coiled-coil domain-containing protein 33 [Stegostoma tigrinum]